MSHQFLNRLHTDPFRMQPHREGLATRMRRRPDTGRFVNLLEKYREADAREWSPAALRCNERVIMTVEEPGLQISVDLGPDAGRKDGGAALRVMRLLSTKLDLAADLVVLHRNIGDFQRGNFSDTQTCEDREYECQSVPVGIPRGFDDAEDAADLDVGQSGSPRHGDPRSGMESDAPASQLAAVPKRIPRYERRGFAMSVVVG